MMYRYGRKSTTQISTVHLYLQLIMRRVLLTDDHSIDQGGRTIGQQQAYFDRKASKLRPPKGKHLLRLDPTQQFGGAWAFAVDACPYIKGKRLATSAAKFGPDQRAQFAWFLRRVEQEGHRILDGTGWKLRFGINWDGDAEILSDQKFHDFFHIEMVRTEKPFFPSNAGISR